MEASLPYTFAIIGLVIGFIAGLVCYRLFSKGARDSAALKQTLLEREHQIAELKKGMGDHLSGMHQRLANIRFEADQLEQQMANEAAQWKLGNATPPLMTEATQAAETDSRIDMPRDYAAGTSGTLSEDFGLKDNDQTPESTPPQPPRY